MATAYAGTGLSPRKRVGGKPFTVEHFRRWSRRFRLKDGSLFVLEEWEALFLEDLFARDDLGLPVFQELWLVVPEGNGKTTFFSLVVLYTIEFTPEAWTPVAASARDQAVDLTYRIAAGFVKRNHLEDVYQLHPGYRQIVHKESLGAAKIFASDAASGDGVDPTLALIEELHRLSSMDLYETWAGKLDKSGGQMIVASTAGEPGSPFEQLRKQIRQAAIEVTRDGCFVRAAAFGVVLHEYALPENGDPEDLDLVAAANPSSRITAESLAKKRAKPSWNLPHWKRFTCNIATRSRLAAITEQEWLNSRTNEQIPEQERIWVGLDVGWKGDTTALVPLWIRNPDFRLFGPATILVPPRDGNHLPPDAIKRAFDEINRRNPVHTVVMDMSRAEDIAAFLIENGVSVIEHSTHNKPMALAYERFMEALRNQRLRHTGDPGLSRHALSAVTKITRFGETTFDIANRNYRLGHEIDALIAAAMVHSIAAHELDSVSEPMVAVV